MDDESSVGARLREMRDRKGLTQHDVAEAVGVRAQQVWRWEKDRRTPNREMLERLADVLDTTAVFLFSGVHADATADSEPGESPTRPALAAFFRMNPDLEEWERRALRNSARYLGPPKDPGQYHAILAGIRQIGPPTGEPVKSTAGDDL